MNDLIQHLVNKLNEIQIKLGVSGEISLSFKEKLSSPLLFRWAKQKNISVQEMSQLFLSHWKWDEWVEVVIERGYLNFVIKQNQCTSVFFGLKKFCFLNVSLSSEQLQRIFWCYHRVRSLPDYSSQNGLVFHLSQEFEIMQRCGFGYLSGDGLVDLCDLVKDYLSCQVFAWSESELDKSYRRVLMKKLEWVLVQFLLTVSEDLDGGHF